MATFQPRITEKRWSIEKEEELVELWEKEGLYKPVLDSREVIVIDTPPPYASGKWHVGGAAHYAQIDMIARYFRMKGYTVIVPFYADRNGLPVEVQVEKKYGLNPHEMAKTREGREKFLELCKQFLDKAEAEIVKVWRRLGCSFDYWREGTDSEKYRAMTQATFIELYKKNLIYEAERPVNWCPRCRTTLADSELEYVEEESYLYYIKFRVIETGEEVVVATTRPEMLRSCKALVFKTGDPRYARLKGLHAITPVYGHELIILDHPEVDPSFGTGLMMVCSYGDHADVKMFRDLGLDPEIIINKDGTMNEKTGPLAGLRVEEARRRIGEELERNGFLVKKEKIKHSIPVCWRCKTPIQIITTREWFLKQLEFKDKLLEVVDKIEFKPEFHKARLVSWIKSVSSDWPISRDRYYATEVPVWRCRKCGSVLVPEPGRYYRPWRDEPPWDKCPVCGAPREMLVGESKVFDTWFDSSISVLYASGYMHNPDLYKRVKYTLRPQGVDIVRTWLYYTILRVYQLKGEPAFKWVRITGMGLDEKGEEMHKSKGNVIDPEPFINKYGADAFRYWAAASSRLGYDYRFSENMIKTGLLFVTKLWNIARFISSFPEPGEYVLRGIDEATIAYLHHVIKKVDEAYSNLDVYEPIHEIYQFTWNYFASHYIELVKSRAYNANGKYDRREQAGAWFTLHYVLRNILRMLAPIMPFVTDALYRRLYGRSVHLEEFPAASEEYLARDYQLALKTVEVDSAIWGFKKKKGMKLSDPVKSKVYLPAEVGSVLEELRDLHKLEDVELYTTPPTGAVNIGGPVYIVE
ncbi:valine--tRNA ligase [Thermogladius sp. 4427co]|uniref:valine--tRNA ligase n=1 Tax=Thermogladius sp. 4427co TaxID=3450718 RepID=UPI003F78FB43